MAHQGTYAALNVVFASRKIFCYKNAAEMCELFSWAAFKCFCILTDFCLAGSVGCTVRLHRTC
jgi:hypothetical protein